MHWIGWLLLLLVLASALFASFPLLLVLPWLLGVPFQGFTFTDPLDFAPLTLVLAGLIALAWRSTRHPYPERWVRAARVLTWVSAVGPPVALLGSLYLLSWRGSILRGHWPRYMADDPKYIGGGDTLYQSLFNGVHYVEAFAGFGLWMFAALLLHLRAHLSARQAIWLAVLFLASWLTFLWEPGGRFFWWMD